MTDSTARRLDFTSEIRAALDKGMTPAAIAAELILPMGDIIAVQKQMQAEQAPAPLRPSPSAGAVVEAHLHQRIDRLGAHLTRAVAGWRAEIDRLTRDLDALTRRAGASKNSSGIDPKAVRAWARENGVDCPAFGRVPRTVVDAYRAATSEQG